MQATHDPGRAGGRSSGALAALCCGVIALCIPIGAVAQVRGDGIAAIVGANTPRAGASVVLLSDVELRARIRLAGESQGELPLGPLAPALLGATLQEIVGELLIAREAERVQLATPSESDVRNERRRLEQQAGGAERLERLLDAMAARPAEIEVIVQRRALVGAFLQANLEGTQTIPDAELDRVYASGNHPFLGQSLDDVREPLRVWMVRQLLSQAVERWVSVLRGRTTVRIVAPYATERR